MSKTCSYPEEKDTSKPASKPVRVGLLGISGNFNSEAFEKLNASGKITSYARLMETESTNLTLYLSLNKNISRADTLFAPSILFPDLGNVAFDATLQYSKLLNDKKNDDDAGHYLVPFIEGWIKDFKIGTADSNMIRFVTVNYTAGLQYVLHQEIKKEGEEDRAMFFSASLYFTRNMIQTKDNDDFQKLANKNYSIKMPINYNHWGLKLAMQYDEFQFYFDARNIIGSEKRIPDKNLRGFNYSIGFVTNVNPFSKKKS